MIVVGVLLQADALGLAHVDVQLIWPDGLIRIVEHLIGATVDRNEYHSLEMRQRCAADTDGDFHQMPFH